MTTKEAIASVTAFLPSRTVFATKEVASHFRSSGERSEYVELYRISILPGLDGELCQQFDGESFEQALDKLRSETTPIVSSGNDE